MQKAFMVKSEIQVILNQGRPVRVKHDA